MFRWFIDWTTKLNSHDPLAFAAVTVVTMATIGVVIAVAAELVLKQLARKPGAPDPHASGH